MNEQNMTTIITENASVDVNTLETPKMTKEEAQQLSDAELLQMVQKAQGHTGNDFKEYMNLDFSYTTLTGLLRERGFESGWHKTSDGATPTIKPTVIRMKKNDGVAVRQSYMVDKSIAEEWKQFNKHVPYKTVTLGWALRRFMDDVKSGRIKFELEI